MLRRAALAMPENARTATHDRGPLGSRLKRSLRELALNLADPLSRLAFSCYRQSACLERVATRPVRPSAVSLNEVEGSPPER